MTALVLCSLGLGYAAGLWSGWRLWRVTYNRIEPMRRGWLR